VAVLDDYQGVATKQEKARGYQWGTAQERWLLVYAAGEGLTDLAVNLKDPQIGEPTPFTRIFLWDKFSETVYCLSPGFATVFTGDALSRQPHARS
jgi:hypothetical protein